MQQNLEALQGLLSEIRENPQPSAWGTYLGKKTRNLMSMLVYPDDTVLDVGCGTGKNVRYISPACKSVYGIDPLSSESIDRARQHYVAKNVKYLVGYAESLPFPPDMFDVVTCISVLQHVGDQVQALNEMNRVLKLEGALLLAFPQTIRESTKRRNTLYTKHLDIFTVSDMLRDSGFVMKQVVPSGLLHPLVRNVNLKSDLFYWATDAFANSFPDYCSHIHVVARKSTC